MTTVEIELQNEVALVWLDRQGEGPNLLDRSLLAALPGLLNQLESADDVKAVVLASRNDAGFVAGADIALFDELSDRESVLELISHAQSLVERFARLSKPTVAAIHGPCAGGGLELALACDYRLASSDPRTALSLPEVRLGLLPALGGTQRLPRLIGLRAALELLLSGRAVYSRSARKLGLIDAVIHREGLVSAAQQAARHAIGRPFGGRRASAGFDWLLASPPASELIFRRAAKASERQTRGNYPAPPRILDTLRRTFGGTLEHGLRIEAEAFADLLLGSESRALRHLFFVRGASRKNPIPAAPRPVREVAVLGAGLMGAGIAQVSSYPAGFRVRLRDRTFDLAAKGVAVLHRGLTERVGKGMTAFERDVAVQRVRPIREDENFQGVDLTIEAVPEELELKRRVLSQVEAVGRPDHIFASNTSSLPIAEIAEGALRPSQVVGMHYFSPVPKMPLLEVVRGPRTSPETVATAVAVGLAQGKSVIVVADSPGFYVNRILAPYLNEALLLVKEGAAIDEVDRAMKECGFPVGPFRLLDNVGLEVAVKVTEVLAPLFATRGVVLENSTGRLPAAGLTGRKSGKGFYLYPSRGRRRVNPAAYRLLGAESRVTVPPHEIADRVLLSLVNEAVRCLDEGIIDSPDSGDAGAVFGLGFPPFLGGPFHYLRGSGAGPIRSRLEALEARHGPRFRPADGLQSGAGNTDPAA